MFVDGYPAIGQLKRFELRQGYEKHTIAIIDLSVATRLLRTPGAALHPEAAPMTVQWGSSASDQATFYGYVNHHEVLGATGSATVVRYMCLGTSMPLNAVASRSWRRVTASAIATQIAKRYRFRALIHRSEFKLDVFTTGTDSDFQALQRLAAETGYRAWVDGGSLYFVDPRVLITRPVSDVPTFSTVTDFHVTSGTRVPRDSGRITDKVVHGRDPRTRKAFVVRSRSLLRANANDTVGFRPLKTVLPGEVSTYAQARARVDQASRTCNWHTADVVVPLTARVRPGRLIGIGGPRVPADDAGRWMVESTRHLYDAENRVYTSELSLARDDVAGPTISHRSQLINTPETVRCVRRGGGPWEAASLDAVYLS